MRRFERWILVTRRVDDGLNKGRGGGKERKMLTQVAPELTLVIHLTSWHETKGKGI
jgi:hypothetical protein